MTKLIIATENFPYGRGEDSFILPELRRLKEEYDITILSHASREQYQNGMQAPLPEGISVIWQGRPVLSGWDKLKASLLYALDGDGRQEIREIIHQKKNKKERLYQSLAFYAQAMRDLKNLRKADILRSDEPVIYYSFWYTYYCYSAVRLSGHMPHLRVLTRTHGYDLYHERMPGGRQPFRHQMERKLAGIVFLGEFARNYYRLQVQGCGHNMPKTYLCPIGTEKIVCHVAAAATDEFRLISCSSVIPLKRVERIIDGLAETHAYKIFWLHMGGGDGLADMANYAAQRLKDKAEIRYSFTGEMKHADVLRYYETNHADCFITTSATEGMPVSVMEAMSCSIPIIAAAVGGIPEMIDHNGILLSADPTAKEVADALERMVRMTPEERDEMRRRSYDLWEKKFDIQTTVKKLSEALTECAKIKERI